jgi:hypothetical protein
MDNQVDLGSGYGRLVEVQEEDLGYEREVLASEAAGGNKTEVEAADLVHGNSILQAQEMTLKDICPSVKGRVS